MPVAEVDRRNQRVRRAAIVGLERLRIRGLEDAAIAGAAVADLGFGRISETETPNLFAKAVIT